MADSDEEAEEVKLKKPQERIFYGSLAAQEEQRLKEESKSKEPDGSQAEKHATISPPARAAIGPASPAPKPLTSQQKAIESGVAAGNINYAGTSAETLPLEEKSQEAKERHQKLLQQLEMQKRARTLAVPTSDAAVKKMLRELGHPICLFGEEAPERRDRLRDILSKMAAEGELPPPSKDEKKEEEEEVITELFYTPGTPELKMARIRIAKYSLPRAHQRLQVRKHESLEPGLLQEKRARTVQTYNRMKRTTNIVSQIGDERPLTAVAFSPDCKNIVTGSASSACKLWSLADHERKMTYRGHTSKITSVAFHPAAGTSMDSNVTSFATASLDFSAKLWALDKPTELASLDGHTARLATVAFHPSGSFLATTSFDQTWRLWDLETQKELLQQEGHSKEVYGVAFQCDGSLIVTSGLDCAVIAWDLRSGKQLKIFNGHVAPVLAVDWNPNGFMIASGSSDHTCRIWDLRKQSFLYSIPAHSHLITSVKYEPEHGRYLVTASHDKTCKMWSAFDYTLLTVMAGHENHVMDIDISADSKYVVSASSDRTWKLWASED